LNTYGVAEYKLPLVESLREIEMLSQLGVEFHFETMIDAQVLVDLERTHDAIFLGIGLGAIHQLGVPGEQLPGVTNALDLIAGYKSGKLTQVPPRVVVVGAGNTAIDAAIASVRLGATDVHIIYRRGEEQMSAFNFEYEHARLEGVKFLWHAQPTRILGRAAVEGIELIQLAATADGSIIPEPSTEFSLAADLIVLAIGQGTQSTLLGVLASGAGKLQLQGGRIVIDRATGQTSHAKFFSGGDCTNGGREVVDAVADGKRAGIGIAAWLEAKLARS
jgi:glutamate synthase (NADPH/NADH) small chain